MPKIKLSALPLVSSVTTADSLYLVQNGSSYRATVAQIGTAATLPAASDAITTATALRFGAWGDSLTYGIGGTAYPTQLEGLIYRDVYNGGIGGYTSTQIASAFLAATDKYNYATIIWSGRNDPANSISPSTTLANIASMVTALGHTRYLVLSVLNANTEPINSSAYNAIISLNSSLASVYGANYFDVRAYLVSQYNPSIPQDVTDHGNDVPPSSLRSDTLHLNTAGYLKVAQQIAAKMAILDPPEASVVVTNVGALLAAPAGPIGLVEPTDGYFNNVTAQEVAVFGEVTASHVQAMGSDGLVIINRRDTNVEAWGVYSVAGELTFINVTLDAAGLVIDTSSNATIAGTVATGSGITSARPTATTVGARWFDTTLGIPIWWNGTHWVNASGSNV